MNRRMAAAPARPPGWNGNQITDPVKFLNSILQPIIDRTKRVDELTPTYKPSTEEDHPYMLGWDPVKSISDTQSVPSLGLTRIASDANNNNCWFHTFLFCMSSSFRALSAKNRRPIVNVFRSWCANHIKEIYSAFPQKIKSMVEFEDITEKYLRTDLSNSKKEIEILEGLVIAWFFGINCIYFATPGMYSALPDSTKYEAICESMIQSPDCKVICIAYTGNHYEPLIHAVFDEPTVRNKAPNKTNILTSRLVDTESTTIFSWDDQKLCKAIKVAMESSCSTAEFGIMKEQPWKVTCAAAGGGKRRRSAHRKTRRTKRRRSTRRR